MDKFKKYEEERLMIDACAKMRIIRNLEEEYSKRPSKYWRKKILELKQEWIKEFALQKKN